MANSYLKSEEILVFVVLKNKSDKKEENLMWSSFW
jgi:hypothetical protein